MKSRCITALFWLTVAGNSFYFAGMNDLGAANQPWRVYFGTYTGQKSQGIYVASWDPATGALGTPELAANAKNPSFLAKHPTRPWLYAVGEMNDFAGKRAGAVSAFQMDGTTGKLTLLNQQPSGGTGPCHLAIDASGQCVLVANYGSGSIAALPIAANGKLQESATPIQHQGSSVNRERQAGPHAHFIAPDPANRLALACDLGLDKILVYRLDPAQGRLTPNDPPSISVKPGAGPRHLVFHPNGRRVYLLNEMASSLIAMTYDPADGKLQEIQTLSTLPEDFQGRSSGAEVQIHPSGTFLYASNRGHDSIAVFAVSPDTGRLTSVEYRPTLGKTPRHFAIDPSGTWLLAENQDSGTVVVFKLDPKTGRLTPTGQSVELGAPVCATFSQ